MKVAMYYNNSDVRVEELDTPKINEGELLVKIQASGICGSDVMEWYRVKQAPRVLGHEVAGVVEEVGKGVTKFKKGDRVFVTHHVPCFNCHHCHRGRETSCETLHNTNFDPGGFAEYIRVPELNVQYGVLKLPDSVSFEEGSFVEPLGCVVRAQNLVNVHQGDTVLVIGSGISGILHIQLAKARGAAKVIATNVSEYRLNKAKEFGADIILNAKEDVPAKVRAANDGRGADIVILCTGAEAAVQQALDSVGEGGMILFFAPANPGGTFPIDLNKVWSRGLTLVNSYAAAGDDLEESLELIRSKKVNVKDMITHRISLDKIQEGFSLMTAGGESLKVIVESKS